MFAYDKTFDPKVVYGLLVGFGLMFDKGQKQSSTLSCDSSYLYNTFFYHNTSGFLAQELVSEQ